MNWTERLLCWYARHCPLQKGKWRLVEHGWQWACGNGSTQRTATLQAGGYRMSCDISLLLQRQFYFYGTYFLERANLDAWAKHCQNSAVIFDVGANVGIYSLTAAAKQPKARIHAFEPTAHLAAHLRQTLITNQIANVEVNVCAVDETSGHALLNVWGAETEQNEGLNFVTQQAVATHTVPIQTVTLDAFCEGKGIDQIDLLKIDIQGNEAKALRGARQLLAAGKIQCLFLELNWDGLNPEGCPASECIQLLDGFGYLFKHPNSTSAAKAAGEWLQGMSDVVAVRR
jgi:FkbM family methyltransferase